MIYTLRRFSSFLLVLVIGSFVSMSNARNSDLNDPERIFSSAVAVWHLADARDSAGEDSSLTPRGDVRFGTELKGTQREASLKRGGDGRVAELRGGWLDAGQGRKGELNIPGEQFTALIRMRAPTLTAWDTRGYFTKGGSHDRLVFNFFTYDFSAGPEKYALGM